MKALTDVLESSVTPLYESLLDDFEDLASKADPHATVEKFLQDNYKGLFVISEKPINGVYEVYGKSDISVKNSRLTELTNGLFVWDSAARDFKCVGCMKLQSLKGAPKKVGGCFDLTGCISLTSLEGASEEVGGNFSCSTCMSLKSLEGAPKKVGNHFFCNDCGKQFTEEEVRKISKIKGTVITKFR